MPAANPVIFVPGILGTYLRDQYPVPPEVVWSVLTKDFERSKLHPDDLRFEAAQPARILPDQPVEIAYEEIVEELRYNLSSTPEDPVPVYPFGYDWRQPLEVVEAQLDAFINEVIERTKLMRNYHEAGYSGVQQVNLVAHSMGGLVVAGLIEGLDGDKLQRIDRVVTLGTPFQGSFEAPIKIATGTANLGVKPPSSREREAARVTPGLYHLLPAIDATGGTAGDSADFFDRANWQPSVLATLKDYVMRFSVPAPSVSEADAKATKLFDRLLGTAGTHRARVNSLDLAGRGFDQGRWLCIIGAGVKTRIAMKVVQHDGSARFDLSSTDREDRWGNSRGSPADQRKTGDGVVPFNGGVPRFLDYNRLVCVTPDDFGYWELKDRLLTSLDDFHVFMPGMNMLHRLIVCHLTGREPSYGNVWGRRAPGVGKTEWRPPVPGLRDKT